jgi:hypothetical protein
MKKQLKVWGGMKMYQGRQVRAIVAAYTKKQACGIAGISSSYFRDYWCETGNQVELETATRVGMWVYDGNGLQNQNYLRCVYFETKTNSTPK